MNFAPTYSILLIIPNVFYWPNTVCLNRLKWNRCCEILSGSTQFRIIDESSHRFNKVSHHFLCVCIFCILLLLSISISFTLTIDVRTISTCRRIVVCTCNHRCHFTSDLTLEMPLN